MKKQEISLVANHKELLSSVKEFKEKASYKWADSIYPPRIPPTFEHMHGFRQEIYEKLTVTYEAYLLDELLEVNDTFYLKRPSI